MGLNKFVDAGVDQLTVENMNKSIARETDLHKAMNKAGLVQKEVQVTGKNGQTYTRKQWVKASEEQKNAKSIKKQEEKKVDSSSKQWQNKLETALNSAQGTAADYAVGQVLKEMPKGTILKTGQKASIAEPPYTLEVSYTKGDHDGWQYINDDYDKVYFNKISKELCKIKGNSKFKLEVSVPTDESLNDKQTENSTKESKEKISPRCKRNLDKALQNKDDFVDVKNEYQENISKLRKESKTTGTNNLRKQTIAQEIKTLNKELEYITEKVEEDDSPNKTSSTPQKSTSEKYKPSDFLFKQGGEKTASLMNNLDRVFGVKKFYNGSPGYGNAELKNGENINFGMTSDGVSVNVTYKGYVYSGDPKTIAEDLYAKMYNKPYESKARGITKNQPKIDHNTGVAKPKKKTMVQDYFSGNHGHSDGKSALTALLGKGYSKDDIMKEAESQGITWKKNDHAGINWMRASMAIQKHLGK